jgi:hypothetical protein
MKGAAACRQGRGKGTATREMGEASEKEVAEVSIAGR